MPKENTDQSSNSENITPAEKLEKYLPNYVVFSICSDKPGTGLTTLSEKIAEFFSGTRKTEKLIAGGRLMRSLAKDWLERQISIEEYADKLEELFNEPEKLVAYLKSIFIEKKDYSEEDAVKFEQAIKKSEEVIEIFDKVTDFSPILMANTMAKEEEKFFAIIDAKIAVLLEELGEILAINFDQRIEIFKVLLTVDDFTSNLRVLARDFENKEELSLSREIKEILKEENSFEKAIELSPNIRTIKANLSRIKRLNKERMERDWERYQKVYGICLEDLKEAADIIIDTTHLNPDEVLNFLLNKVAEKYDD